MTWPPASLVEQYLLYAALALVGVHLLFLLMLLAVAMIRAGMLSARSAATTS